MWLFKAHHPAKGGAAQVRRKFRSRFCGGEFPQGEFISPEDVQ